MDVVTGESAIRVNEEVPSCNDHLSAAIIKDLYDLLKREPEFDFLNKNDGEGEGDGDYYLATGIYLCQKALLKFQ